MAVGREARAVAAAVIVAALVESERMVRRGVFLAAEEVESKM